MWPRVRLSVDSTITGRVHTHRHENFEMPTDEWAGQKSAQGHHRGKHREGERLQLAGNQMGSHFTSI